MKRFTEIRWTAAERADAARCRAPLDDTDRHVDYLENFSTTLKIETASFGKKSGGETGKL
jgi:hypothetical protein